MTLPAFAAERVHCVLAVAVDRYLLQAPALSSKPEARRCCCRSTGQTNGRTPDRYIDPVWHTIRTASVVDGIARQMRCCITRKFRMKITDSAGDRNL